MRPAALVSLARRCFPPRSRGPHAAFYNDDENTTSERNTYLTPRATATASCSKQSSPCKCSNALPASGATVANVRRPFDVLASYYRSENTIVHIP